ASTGKLPLKAVPRLMRHASLKQTADLYLDSLLEQAIELPPLFDAEETESRARRSAEYPGTTGGSKRNGLRRKSNRRKPLGFRECMGIEPTEDFLQALHWF